ncbi:MAG TPA: 1-phosphofructokinase family hexose kinase [Desulfuromonadales bacterium]|nr:1-phosphofructokinase family hexose kinase [Desulfuromonadales bacterium]
MQIATLTMNPAVDVYITVERVTPAHKLRSKSARRDPGGGGINVARAIHILKGEATAFFPAGGPTGQLLQNLLDEQKVPCRIHEIEGMTRESFTAQDLETEEEYRFVLPGPELTEQDWQACLTMLQDLEPTPGYLVASGSLPPGAPDDFYARVARWARESGVRMILDTSGPALEAALEEGVYLIKPNRRELQSLTGRELKDAADQEEASRDLLADGKSAVVALTLGEEGALLTSEEGSRRIEVPEQQVRSSVGAGDSFVAGMVSGLVRKLSLQEAFCYGTAAGNAALLTPGTELCRREDVERLYQKICGAL